MENGQVGQTGQIVINHVVTDIRYEYVVVPTHHLFTMENPAPEKISNLKSATQTLVQVRIVG